MAHNAASGGASNSMHLYGVAADIVVSSCGAINSAALLLRSANDKHPHGLANGCGAVGRSRMRSR